MPKLRIEEARHAGKRPSPGDGSRLRQHSTASPRRPRHIRDVDTLACAEAQLARLAELRANREGCDEAACPAALERAAWGARCGNLLEYVVAATRARATIGEISDAMEDVFSETAPPHP